jgi:hypothetical protein
MQLTKASVGLITERWLNNRATDKQRSLLLDQGIQISPMDFSWTKYKAGCALNFFWNKDALERAFYAAEHKLFAN